jgi:hypothetical protein
MDKNFFNKNRYHEKKFFKQIFFTLKIIKAPKNYDKDTGLFFML